MAKVTYKAPPGDAESLKWGGQDFKNGEGVDVDENTPQGRAILSKAQHNPYFEVSGGDKKGDKQEAPVLGGYKDAYTGQEFDLIRKPAPPTYGGGAAGPAEIGKPSSATQGSTAIESSRVTTTTDNEKFRQAYGGTIEEVNKGEAESQSEAGRSEGQEPPKRGRPPGSGKK
jgi:hypothetical protein